MASLIPRSIEDSLVFKSVLATIETIKNSNILVFSTLADMKREMSSGTCKLLTTNGSVDYAFVAGNFTGRADDVNFIELNKVPITIGVLARQSARNTTYSQYDSLFNRTIEDKAREILSVTDYGNVGSGIANDSQTITLADQKAAAKGKALFFPAGTYMIDALTATTSWYGEPGTILKFRTSPNTFVAMVTASKDNIVFEGIIFDGNCSADPTTWNLSTQDSFTGASGLSVENCKRPKVVNCIARNMKQHGFRFYNCNGAVWRDNDAKRCRGKFGDGFIAVSCVGLSMTNCFAEDYTRIGFVVDSFGDNIIACHKISASSCFASNGHHSSYLYGGTEFNAGFWFEHSGDVSMDSCFAYNNVHRGINVCTGSKTNDFPGQSAIISINNCHTVGSTWGILTYSLVDLPVNSKVTNCSAKLATIALEGTANVPGDTFSWVNCHANYDASVSTGWGFSCQVNMAGSSLKPVFHIGEGCTISRWQENLALLRDSGDNAATADIGGYFNPNVGIYLNVNSVRISTGGPVYVRWYEGPNISHDFYGSNTDLWISRGGSSGGVLIVENCSLPSAMLNRGNASVAQLRNCTVRGTVVIRGSIVDVTGGSVLISDSSYLWLLSDSVNKYPAVFVNNVRFHKDISANGEVLRLGFGSVSFQSIISGSIFYNTSTSATTSATTNAFVSYATGAVRTFSNCFADKTVNNITKLDSGPVYENTLSGVIPLDMH